MPKKISVIMPVYNNARFLEKSIESILSQTYENFEFIILDDASTENIGEIIDRFNDTRIVKMENPSNIGLTASLNRCLEACGGDLIARQDSDDISLPERFEEEVSLFEDPDVGLVSTWAETISEDGATILPDNYTDKVSRLKDEDIKRTLEEKNCIIGPAAMYSREAYEKIGLYDSTLYFAQDYNYWLRIAQFFDVTVVPKVLYKRTRNKKSVRRDNRNDDKKVNIIERVKSRSKTHTVIK